MSVKMFQIYPHRQMEPFTLAPNLDIENGGKVEWVYGPRSTGVIMDKLARFVEFARKRVKMERNVYEQSS